MMKFSTIFSLLFIFSFSISCKRESRKFSIDETLNKQISTKHFKYYLAEDDRIDTLLQEKYIEWLLGQLEVDSIEKITYYKLKNRQQIVEAVGFEANAYANPDSNVLYTIWPMDNHECVHLVLCRNIGCPPALFGEGVAVAHQAYLKEDDFIPSWNGKDFHEIARKYHAEGKRPSLDSLMGIYSFWNVDPEITYPVAGSFIRYLIDTHGIDKFKRFVYLREYTDQDSIIRNEFYQTYDQDINSFWQEWISFIETYDK